VDDRAVGDVGVDGVGDLVHADRAGAGQPAAAGGHADADVGPGDGRRLVGGHAHRAVDADGRPVEVGGGVRAELVVADGGADAAADGDDVRVVQAVHVEAGDAGVVGGLQDQRVGQVGVGRAFDDVDADHAGSGDTARLRPDTDCAGDGDDARLHAGVVVGGI